MSKHSVEIPAYTAVAAVVSRNRATQLVVPSQTATLIQNDHIDIQLVAGESFRVLKNGRGLGPGELALRLPRTLSGDGSDLPASGEISWIGSRSASLPDQVLASYEGAFSFLQGSDDG